MARNRVKRAIPGIVAACVVSMTLWAKAAEPPPGARVYLKNGESFPAPRLIYRDGTLVAQLPYGQLTFAQDQLAYVAWGTVGPSEQDLSRAIVLADGSRLTGAAISIDERGVVARTPYGTLVMTELGRLRSIGFAPVEPLPQEAAAVFQFFLADGGIVRGRVLGADSRTLVVEAPYGTLQLAADHVGSFRSRVVLRPAKAGQVDFVNGDRIVATLREVRGHQWVFELQGGQLVVDRPAAVARVHAGGVIQPVPLEVPAFSSASYGTPRLTEARLATGPQPRGLAVSPDGKRLYVANAGADSLSVFDLASMKKVIDIPVVNQPWGVALSPDDRFVYVSRGPSPGALAIVDSGAQRKVAEVGTGGSRGLAVSPDGRLVYVAEFDYGTLSVIDAASRRSLSGLRLDPPYHLAVSSDGRMAYVTSPGRGTVSLVDLTAGKVVGRVGELAAPKFIVLAPDGRLGYVTEGDGVTVLDLATREKVGRIALGGEPEGAALSPDGRFLYVANPRTGMLSVIDAQTLEKRFDIPVGPAQQIAFSPDGRRAYVTLDSQEVAVIDTGKGRIVGDMIIRWEGPPVEGIITFLSPDFVFVANEEGEQRIPLADVRTIHFQRRTDEAG